MGGGLWPLQDILSRLGFCTRVNPPVVAPYFGLYKIFFYVWGFVHKSILLLLPRTLAFTRYSFTSRVLCTNQS